ncbi:MAG: hypothetical protein U0787_16790 [Polyangia bacterium]
MGDLVAGIVVTPDADNVWVGGSDGLAKLNQGQWDRYAAGTTVTALVHDGGSGVWIGTSGKGIMRVVKGDMLQFGMAEGNDIDNVRAMVADNNGSLLAVGDGPGGQRIAFYDGTRFWSYRVDSANIIEWVQRVGGELYLGAGQSVWTMKRVATPAEVRGPLKFSFSGSPSMGAPKAQPLAGLLVKEAAPPPPPPAAAPPPPPPEPAKGKGGKKDKGGKKTSALLVPSQDQYAAVAQPASATRPDRPWLVAGPGGTAATAPLFDTDAVDVRLPDGITSVSADADSLYVGTRFLGVMRIQKGKQTPLRLFDLTAGAERLSVACINNNDCYVATGGTQSWRFDGQTFEVTNVDPEKGSHVLAVVRDPMGAVIALHRGASSRSVRISRVGNKGDWSPVGLTPLEVPTGVPDLSFASFSPKGQLWVGLRYVDKEQDARAYGAAEVYVDDSRVVYHRQRPTGTQPGVRKVSTSCRCSRLPGSDRRKHGSLRGPVRCDCRTTRPSGLYRKRRTGIRASSRRDRSWTKRSNLDRDEPRHRRGTATAGVSPKSRRTTSKPAPWPAIPTEESGSAPIAASSKWWRKSEPIRSALARACSTTRSSTWVWMYAVASGRSPKKASRSLSRSRPTEPHTAPFRPHLRRPVRGHKRPANPALSVVTTQARLG